jgi:hypothetical protein
MPTIRCSSWRKGASQGLLLLLGMTSLLLGEGASCHQSTPLPPSPTVRPVPPELAGLRIHVLNASDAESRAAHEDVSGYTMHVRGAVQRNLARAGYTVVVSRVEPRDLVALVQVNWEGLSLHAVGGTGVVTLTLQGPQEVVEQLSGLVKVDQQANLVEASVVPLVERIAASVRVQAFAASRPPGLGPALPVPCPDAPAPIVAPMLPDEAAPPPPLSRKGVLELLESKGGSGQPSGLPIPPPMDQAPPPR